MFHIKRIKVSWPRNAACRVKEETFLSPYIAIPFLLGLILGSLTGSLTELPLELFFPFESKAPITENLTILSSFWRSIRFPMLSALLATWIIGPALIPLLSACRAYILACSAAIILRKNAVYACLNALISLGLPALMNLPAFLLASADAFTISRYLLTRNEKFRIRDLPLLQHLMIVLLLCIIETMYLTYIVPLITAHIVPVF